MIADRRTDDRRAEGDAADVRLAPMREAHVAAWRLCREQPTSQRFNPLLALSLEELKRRVATYSTSDLSDRTRGEYRWVVECRDETVGFVSMTNPSWGMGYAEIGYMMLESFHARGLGTRAVALLLDKLFRETDLRRLIANISVENAASIRLVERLGFTLEGRLREHYLIQGRRVDEFVYGLLRREWTVRK